MASGFGYILKSEIENPKEMGKPLSNPFKVEKNAIS